jgi:hypothetical protein
MASNSSAAGETLTISSGLFLVIIALKFIHEKYSIRKTSQLEKQEKELATALALSLSLKERSEGDFYHQLRYQKSLQERGKNCILHFGSCHCGKVQFKIFAPRTLYAVDIPSKLRYPHTTIGYSDFELISTDLSVLSIYPVQQVGASLTPMPSSFSPASHSSSTSDNMGIHSFCSFCGMHILYSPSAESPVEIQINSDCLDRDNIDNIHIAYHSLPESIPHPNSEELHRRGSGYYGNNNNNNSSSSNSTPLASIKSDTVTEEVYPSPRRQSSSHLNESITHRGMNSMNFGNDLTAVQDRDLPDSEIDTLSFTSYDSDRMRNGSIRSSSFSLFSDEDANSYLGEYSQRSSRWSYNGGASRPAMNGNSYYRHSPQRRTVNDGSSSQYHHQHHNSCDYAFLQRLTQHMSRHVKSPVGASSSSSSSSSFRNSHQQQQHQQHRRERRYKTSEKSSIIHEEEDDNSSEYLKTEVV